MRTLKAILLIILIIVVSAFGIGFLLPRTALVSRSMLIHAQPRQVFDQMNIIKNWENWSPWSKLSQSVTIDYSGPEKGANASFTWTSQSDKIGNGAILIVNSYPYDSVIFSMNFGDRGNALGKFTLTKSGNETFVTFQMTSDLGYNPVNRYLGLLFNKFAGNDFDKSLMNLQYYLGSLPKNMSVSNIFETDIPACITIAVRDTSNYQTISAKLAAIYKKLFNIIKLRKLQVTGAPYAMYYTVTPELIDFEAGIKINKLLLLQDSTIIFREFPRRHVLSTIYTGNYKGIVQAYNDLETYAVENKLQTGTPVMEEYITDSSVEKDSSKWQTNIYVPLK